MQPFFAGGVPTGIPDQVALAMAALVLVFPAACLLSALLQPTALSPRAMELLRSARDWCHVALGFSVAGMAMIEFSMFRQGYAIYDDLSSHLLWTHSHLYTATVALLLSFTCHHLCRKASTLQRSQAPASSPELISPYKTWAVLFAMSVGAALLFHRHPFIHIPVAVWVAMVVLMASIFAANDFLAPLPVSTDPATPSTPPSDLWLRLSPTILVAVPGVLALTLAIAATLGLARWQEHLARLHGDHLAAQLEEITQHGSQPYPAGLPSIPAFASPWYLTVPVTYQPGTSPRDYRISHPLIMHPGAQMRRDPQSPAWYWWGRSDR